MVSRQIASRLIALVACLALSACYWTSDYPLMSLQAVEPSPPLAAGAYQSASAGNLQITGTDGNVAYIQYESTSYEARFARIDGDFHLAQITQPGQNFVAYAMVRTIPNGFVLYQFTCAPDAEDRPLATSAGAYVNPNRACVFAPFDQVLSAMRSAVQRVGANPTWYDPATFTRS